MAAQEARTFHMTHLVRYAGCWIDKARAREGQCFSNRLSWWLQEGAELPDPLLAYADVTVVNVPTAIALEPPPVKA